MNSSSALDLSILVCAHNMARELPRTLKSLSPAWQRNTDGLRWEVEVLDNGSSPPIHLKEIEAVLPGVRLLRPERISQSPAAAINWAMNQLHGKMLGLWIDGARMASPGMIAHALEAWRSDATRAIGTVAFHLGPDVQMRSVDDGYDAAREDALLASVPWESDGYRLFDIAVLAGSSVAGWFGCISETNGLFMDRAFWQSLGGLDERFTAAGGGYVNLDLWERAVALSGGHPWIMLGEGTFHQVHGGAATNGTADARAAMSEEYARLHGKPFQTPVYRPHFVGTLDATRFASGAARPLDTLRKVHAIRGRHFRVDLPAPVLQNIQAGTLRTRYKGLRLAKNPFDLALYSQWLERLRPATIVEVGTSEGGSALWLHDQCVALGLSDTRVISIDLSPPTWRAGGITLASGDSREPEKTFPSALIDAAPHPWLVIEDSAHTYDSVTAVLAYFDRRLVAGDLMVVEDGVLADLEGPVYRELDDGPNRALAEFLARAGTRYEIDQDACDFYGHNVTWSPNGWLRRV